MSVQTIADTKYWHRVYKIDIVKPDGTRYTYNSLVVEEAKHSRHYPFDIKFDVEMALTITPKFSVDILGLSKETIEELTIWDTTQALAENIQIHLYAGYKEAGEELLAAGMILHALPVGNPPEVWMHFECMTNGESITPVYKPDYSSPNNDDTDEGDSDSINLESDDVGTSVQDNIQRGINALANAIEAQEVKDLRANTQGAQPEGVVTMDYAGKTASQMADEVSKKSRVRIAVRAGDETGLPHKNNSIVVVDDENWEQRNDVKETLSIETGLLSITDVNFLRATATRLLDTKLQMLDICKVNSIYIPSYSGRFLVIGVRHTGHFRGNEWFTKLTLLKQR